MEYDYMEVVFCRSLGHSVYKYDVGKERFYDMLKRVKASPLFKDFKCYQNDVVETRKSSLLRVQQFQGNSIKETKMFHIEPIDVSPCYDGNCVQVKLNRHKVPDVMFPSSLHYDAVKKLRRLTFRVTNRIFFNFQIEESTQQDQQLYKVYVNFNNSKEADNACVTDIIDNIVNIVCPV